MAGMWKAGGKEGYFASSYETEGQREKKRKNFKGQNNELLNLI